MTLAPEFSGRAELVVTGIPAPAAIGRPLKLFAAVGDRQAEWTIASGDRRFEVSAPFAVTAAPHEVRLWTDTTFVPAEVEGLGLDRRPLEWL